MNLGATSSTARKSLGHLNGRRFRNIESAMTACRRASQEALKFTDTTDDLTVVKAPSLTTQELALIQRSPYGCKGSRFEIRVNRIATNDAFKFESEKDHHVERPEPGTLFASCLARDTNAILLDSEPEGYRSPRYIQQYMKITDKVDAYRKFNLKVAGTDKSILVFGHESRRFSLLEECVAGSAEKGLFNFSFYQNGRDLTHRDFSDVKGSEIELRVSYSS